MDRLTRIICGTALVGVMLALSGCPGWERRGYDRDTNRSDRYDRDRDRDNQDRDQDRDRDRNRDRDRDDSRDRQDSDHDG